MIEPEWTAQVNALLYRIQKKDSVALKLLYDMTASKLLGLLNRILNDPSEAEDVLQEIFIKLWHQANKYNGSGTAWGWICVLARNQAIDRLRSTARTRSQDSTDASPELLNALVGVDNTSDTHWIGKCLSVLKPQTRDAILLSYIDGYSHSELSEQFTVPLGTIKAWIRRGLQELKQCLAA